ncbi:putative hydroxypyruvate isomerase isoform X2 [Watersipora subatra]|uniref:putative hydroxypyruvate isomerase isoform X2 n=1 Tax=Watersipora subatra TaxID=2589382 RepID=UPI00355C0EA2
MPAKFAANLSWMFKEHELLADRYKAAADAGFKAVESADLTDLPLETLVAAKEAAGVEQVLMNGWSGDMAKGDRGVAAVPGREAAFRDSLEKSITYCKALKCSRMHVIAGRITEAHSEEEMRKVYVANLRYASARLAEFNILALIEPINSKTAIPNYLLDTVDKAMSIIDEVGHPNLKMQLDLYHTQIMHGDLTATIKRCLPYVGYIQIAQVPAHHEPNSDGEINYSYIISLLEKELYTGYIGTEYTPSGNTTDGLAWLHAYTKN